MILEAFGNVHPNSHDIETYILCVQDWLRNMVDSSPGAKGIIAQISKIMCSLRMKSNEKCRRLLNAVLT